MIISMDTKTNYLVKTISQIIYDKKGENILAIDINEVSSVSQAVVIASATIERHAVAIANEIKKRLKDESIFSLAIEGMTHGDWIVMDYQDVIVHIFIPQMREKYDLESLWKEGTLIDTKINTVPHSV